MKKSKQHKINEEQSWEMLKNLPAPTLPAQFEQNFLERLAQEEKEEEQAWEMLKKLKAPPVPKQFEQNFLERFEQECPKTKKAKNFPLSLLDTFFSSFQFESLQWSMAGVACTALMIFGVGGAFQEKITGSKQQVARHAQRVNPKKQRTLEVLGAKQDLEMFQNIDILKKLELLENMDIIQNTPQLGNKET